MERLVKNVNTGKIFISLKYYNRKKLRICDFIETIREDLLKKISKNRGFIDKKNGYIYFEIIYYNKDDDEYDNERPFNYYEDINFGVNGICGDKFVKNLLNYANKKFKEILKDYVGFEYYYENEEYILGDGYHEIFGYYDKECNINKFDKNFIVGSLNVEINIDSYKLEHKKKFYKTLHNDLMEVAWGTDRVLNWCLDFEELRDLKERWGKN